MKFYTLLSIFLIYIIQYTYSFPQNKLPKDAIIVAKDGSGNFKTVIIFFLKSIFLKYF